MRYATEGVILNSFSLLLAALGFALSPPTQAADFHSPRATALGGAGRAGPLLNDAITLNPSFSSFLPAYSVAANYQLYEGPNYMTPAGPTVHGGQIYNFSVQDGRTELFQAGASFTQRSDAAFVHLGLSKAFLKRFAGGISGKLIRGNVSERYTAEAVFSTTAIITEWLQMAFVADNLIELPETVQYGMYREFVLATKFNVMGIVLAYLDPHWVPALPLGEGGLGYAAGLEFVFFQDFFLRAGNFYNSYVPFQGVRGKGVGLGLGWIGPKISIDYGFQRVFEGRQAVSHNFGLTVYF
jgi:hypothetical protein